MTKPPIWDSKPTREERWGELLGVGFVALLANVPELWATYTLVAAVMGWWPW